MLNQSHLPEQRSLGGFSVQYDSERKVHSYSREGFTLYLTDEARARASFATLRSLVEEFVAHPESYPNIDPDHNEFSRIRAVARLGMVDNQPVAVKHSGPESYKQGKYREDWGKEFWVMAKLDAQYRALDKPLPIRPAAVYGYLRVPDDGPNQFSEYLFMEEISNATQARSVHRQTDEYQGLPIRTEGFTVASDPELCAYVITALSLPAETDFVSLADLEKALAQEGVQGFTDLKGGNILKHTLPSGSTEYVIIDQKEITPKA